jgi:hypothetical protein
MYHDVKARLAVRIMHVQHTYIQTYIHTSQSRRSHHSEPNSKNSTNNHPDHSGSQHNLVVLATPSNQAAYGGPHTNSRSDHNGNGYANGNGVWSQRSYLTSGRHSNDLSDLADDGSPSFSLLSSDGAGACLCVYVCV